MTDAEWMARLHETNREISERDQRIVELEAEVARLRSQAIAQIGTETERYDKLMAIVEAARLVINESRGYDLLDQLLNDLDGGQDAE